MERHVTFCKCQRCENKKVENFNALKILLREMIDIQNGNIKTIEEVAEIVTDATLLLDNLSSKWTEHEELPL